MRHYAQSLADKGMIVDYILYGDDGNTGSFEGEVRRAITRHEINRIVVTAPGEYRLYDIFNTWPDKFSCPVEIRDDDRYLTTIDDFKTWAEGRKSLRMEFFYRELRRKYNILMDGDDPVGGAWNYDSENRQPPKEGLYPPHRHVTTPDSITQDVLTLVDATFPHHFGTLDGFDFAVTAKMRSRCWISLSPNGLPFLAPIKMPWWMVSHGCITLISGFT